MTIYTPKQIQGYRNVLKGAANYCPNGSTVELDWSVARALVEIVDQLVARQALPLTGQPDLGALHAMANELSWSPKTRELSKRMQAALKGPQAEATHATGNTNGEEL